MKLTTWIGIILIWVVNDCKTQFHPLALIFLYVDRWFDLISIVLWTEGRSDTDTSTEKYFKKK